MIVTKIIDNTEVPKLAKSHRLIKALLEGLDLVRDISILWSGNFEQMQNALVIKAEKE